MSQIQISDLSFCYEGSDHPVFSHISLTLDDQWKLGLIGRNGRGKPTLLRLLLGTLHGTGRIHAGTNFCYFPAPAGQPETRQAPWMERNRRKFQKQQITTACSTRSRWMCPAVSTSWQRHRRRSASMRTRFIIRGAAGRKGVFMIPIQWKQNDKKTMHVNEAENGVVYLTWPAIEKIEGIRHAFSTRIGGVSKEHLSRMNLSFSRGDDPANVRENYRRFCEAAGFEVENIVTSDQAHTTKVRYVTKADCGSGVTRDRDFHDIDGMITDEPGVVLATFYADCVPLYFVDPVHRAIGLSHSGWRGTVHKMGQATLDAMHERFGTEAKDVIAAVGPSICQDCYEVSGDVIEEFRAAFPETLHEKLFYGKPDGKYQLNLWEANHQILLAAGVPEKQIHLPNLCTCCNPDFLYSHRASKGKRGNLAAFLSLV